jgi:hypothetical protein
MTYKTIYTEVEVDVDMSDFDTEDLIEELESRGRDTTKVGVASDLVRSIYEKRRLGQDYQPDLDQLIYNATGRAI